ncbi:MAG: hypothetical protein AAFW83_14460 [Pseudomonadota bacterium]
MFKQLQRAVSTLFLTPEPSIEKYRIDQAASKADRQQLADELHAAVNKAVIDPYSFRDGQYVSGDTLTINGSLIVKEKRFVEPCRFEIDGKTVPHI